jgi:hypothetical protein
MTESHAATAALPDLTLHWVGSISIAIFFVAYALVICRRVIAANARTLARAMHPTDSVELRRREYRSAGVRSTREHNIADIQLARDDPMLDGTQAPEPPLPFDAADDAGAVNVGEAEAERRMRAGAAWVCIDVLGPDGGSIICPPIVRPRPSSDRAA